MTDAGEATAVDTADSTEATTSPVRLRMQANDLWVTDDLSASDVVPIGDDVLEVTVNLYPPVGQRLSRMVFLADPPPRLSSRATSI